MPTANIASHLKEMASLHPTQVAVHFPVGRKASGRNQYVSRTYRQLDDESDWLAAGLDEIGIGPGMKTVLMVPPSLEFFALTFALFKVGAIPVLVDPGMGIKNLGKCLAEAQPAGFVGVTKAHVARVLFGWARPWIKQTVTVGRRLFWGGWGLKNVVDRGRDRQTANDTKRHWQSPAVSDDQTAAILFTSGSTGVPKGAVYSHGNFTAQVAALKQAFQIQPGEIDLCTFPLFALFAPALGMTAVVPRMDFTRPALVDPNEIETPVKQFAINNLFGSPALLNRVGRRLFPQADSTSAANDPNKLRAIPRWTSLRRVLSAGAPVSPLILERFTRLLGDGVQVFTPYGATESLPVAVIGSEEILGETRDLTAKGAGTCVGRPVCGIEVNIIRITDEPIAKWSDDLLLPRGEIGEIIVHGPMVTQSYFNRPDLTSLAKIHDDASGRMRHRMGDVGYVDEHGRLWFCGRKSHRVVTADRTYFTDPVEGVFNTHPAIFRTALVGVLKNGQVQPVLCVERESENTVAASRHLDDHELIAELQAIGTRFDHTRPIETFLFHQKFPVDIRHNSKIFREKLAVWAAQVLERR